MGDELHICPVDGEELDIKPTQGEKLDQGKLEWDLLPWGFLEEMAKVSTYGKQKYDAHNWKQVKGWRWRYFNAAMRHTVAWFRGQMYDPESGCHHLAHAAVCLSYLYTKEVDNG